MCGRFTQHRTPSELQAFFDLLHAPLSPVRYNIAPTQKILAIRDTDAGRIGDMLQWGLVPVWAKSKAEGSKMINARSETAATKPAFRRAFKRQRCLIPATGFYEWQQTGSKTTQPWHISLKSGEPFAFAGLWESWKSPEGEPVESCTILTTAANEFMAEVHERMPVVLERETWVVWLARDIQDPEAIQPLLQPSHPEIWQRVPVSKIVGNVKNDSRECLQPIINWYTTYSSPSPTLSLHSRPDSAIMPDSN